ncbi:Protein of unknown function [Nakamurella panacisegetis]|uniref:DinB superfamily protein n=1 Tax=Nakamurella panacisegetis TaxID=1090615 RepID=A0A1H0KS46_9ACTN|nr:DUF664 domain-containing protein [Nakamurella panacisegetis]SDO58778.1 Protein of unknown function [Nakamurella panacisegetis]
MTNSTRAVLQDAFDRVDQVVGAVTAGLTEEVGTYRPDAAANSISWLIWHLTRIQDDHLAGITGGEQVWISQGWVDRFSLPFAMEATGYGQDAEEVGAVQVPAELLAAYHSAVHENTVRYLEGLDDVELERVVDRRFDPPVTVAVRLVSVISDSLQHAGQAAYLKGLADRRG